MVRRLLTACLISAALGYLLESDAQASCRYHEMDLLRLQGGSGTAAQIAAARARLDACQGKGTAATWGENSEINLFKPNNLFKPRERQQAAPVQRARRGSDHSAPAGTYRTLCVRPCDGYYFPISNATRRKHLEYDRVVCQHLCPAVEAELYYHSGSQGPEQMRSIEGKRYSELENAFAYRDALDDSCTCGTPPVWRYAAIAESVGAEPEAHPLPRPRPAPGGDPETALNRLGALAFAIDTATSTHTEPAAEDETVRVILPPWDTSADAVLVSPVPNPIPLALRYR